MLQRCLMLLFLYIAVESSAGDVSCGGHKASSCAYCPQGHGASWCNGECHWCVKDLSCRLKAEPCPEHGNWGSWSSYSPCTETCGIAKKVRTRCCDSPPPSNGGKNCAGNNYEFASCDSNKACGVNGGWSSWTNGACSKACGSGVMTKTRVCNNPSPSNGGLECSGAKTETQSCELKKCTTAAEARCANKKYLTRVTAGVKHQINLKGKVSVDDCCLYCAGSRSWTSFLYWKSKSHGCWCLNGGFHPVPYTGKYKGAVNYAFV